MNYWKDLIISSAVGIILTTVKNDESRATFRRALLKIFLAIRSAYPGDVDFR